MATNYSRGRAFEYKARDHCMSKEVGACYVMRAAGSHTLADLAVFFESREYPRIDGLDTLPPGHRPVVWLVQCKTDGKMPGEELAMFMDLAEEVGALPVLAKKGPRGVPVVLINLTNGEEI